MNSADAKLIGEALGVVESILATVRKLAAGEVTTAEARGHLEKLRGGIASTDAAVDAELAADIAARKARDEDDTRPIALPGIGVDAADVDEGGSGK